MVFEENKGSVREKPHKADTKSGPVFTFVTYSYQGVVSIDRTQTRTSRKV